MNPSFISWLNKAQAGIVLLLLLTQAGCGTHGTRGAKGLTGPTVASPTAELSGVREVVAGLKQAVGTASSELSQSTRLAGSAREAEGKLAAERRQMADQAVKEYAQARQATQAEQARLQKIQKEITAAQQELDARKKAEQSVEKRLKFIREVIAELGEHGMTVWNLEESVSDGFKIQFDAAKKLTLGAPPEAGDARSPSRGQFRQLIKIITDMEDNNLPVRLLSYTAGESLEITYTRKDRHLVIRPKAK